jgi:Glycosyl transferase family 2
MTLATPSAISHSPNQSEEAVLDHITPVLLTYNEENNIARTLDRLRWARDVIVVDNFSTNKTVALVKSFSNVRLFQRAFDSHARQWNYAIKDTPGLDGMGSGARCRLLFDR